MNTLQETPITSVPLKTVILTCDVLRDEFTHLSRGIDHIIRIEVLQQGLHNDPPLLRRELQSTVDRIESEFPQAQAIVLGYGLCSRGVEGVAAQRCKLVIARAHDCVTLLLGDRQRYAKYVSEHPGTYWYSPGWNRCHTPPGPERYEKLLNEYRKKFGEEDAQFLMESEQSWFKTYERATFVDLGVPGVEKDVEKTQQCAQWLGWTFDQQHGSPGLLLDLMLGNWDDERFLVLEPGQSVQMTADEKVVTAVTLTRSRGDIK